MGVFNRTKAMEYACQWAFLRNPDFPDYSMSQGGGGDCTNFVSQCMLAGGWTTIPIVNPRGGSMYHGWWSTTYGASFPWCVGDKFADMIETTRRASRCRRDELAIGDIVGVKREDGQIGHVLIVTVVVPLAGPAADGNKTDVYVASHTKDYANKNLDLITANQYGKERMVYWKVANAFGDIYL